MDKFDKSLISIIVPVYNVEDYLKECLNSIINQTYKNLEILLIDDGSSDKSGEICDEYAKNDSRIKVFHKQNGGQSSARNLGLDKSKGDFISFVDSDDVLGENFIQKLYDMASKFQTKMSMISFQAFSQNRLNTDIAQANSSEKILSSKELLKAICTAYLSFSPCIFLYKRDIFDDLRFPEGRIYEDIFISFDVIHKAQNIAYSDAKHYFYRIREGSTVHSFSQKNLIAVDSVQRFTNLIKQNYKELTNEANYALCSSMFDTSIGILRSKSSEFYPKIYEFSNLIKKKLFSVFMVKTKYFKKKILIILLAIHPLLLKAVFKIYKGLR